MEENRAGGKGKPLQNDEERAAEKQKENKEESTTDESKAADG